MQKLKYLDGFRGLAALIVVLSHFIVAFYPALYNGDINQVHTGNAVEIVIAKNPINLLYNGNFAVCIFFILSGYVLSYKYFMTKNSEYLVSGAVKRYFRLLAPVIASVSIVFLLMKLSLFYNKEASSLSLSNWWLGIFWNFDTSYIDVAKNIFFGVFFKYDDKYNTVLWTMTYELFGSFLVFGFLALFGRVKNRFLFYMIIIILLFNTYYLGFILGMLLSDLKNNGYFDNRIFKQFSLKIFFIGIGVLFGSYPTGTTVDNSVYRFFEATNFTTIVIYHIIGAFFIMVVLLNSTKLQYILSKPFFEFLGKISFSMYLLHVIIIGSFTSYMFIKLVNYLSYSTSFIISFIASLPLMLIGSYLIYKYVDKNGIKIANYLYNRIFKQAD
ncbi:acyltransferase [Paenibacillus sp. FSL K6-3166]|uniref:acyltransferase family protein n=1 Tax=unclassified Paenibacillus TaxID=185978 RepID=UPI0015C5D0AC|nr:acyltransferase [Paenibacillus sp. VTT E-133291]